MIHGRYSYSKGCRCAKCKAANTAEVRRWREKYPEHAKSYRRAWIQALRKEVLDHYGGKCVCCGEKTLQFLSLDHKNGGGCKHRREIGVRGSNMWAWVKREGYPDMFQVLCHNCNQAKGYYGRCPHEDK